MTSDSAEMRIFISPPDITNSITIFNNRHTVHGSFSSVPDDVPEDVPEEVPDDVPDDVPADVPVDVSDDVPADVPVDVSDDVPELVPELVPDDVPEDVGGEVTSDECSDAPSEMDPLPISHVLWVYPSVFAASCSSAISVFQDFFTAAGSIEWSQDFGL